MMLGVKFGGGTSPSAKSRIGERRVDTQSVVQGNIEELNRYIASNEQQLRTKQSEVNEAKKYIGILEAQLHQMQTHQKTLEVQMAEERRSREEITQRTGKVQRMYSALKEQAAKLADSFKKTEDMCESAVAENSARDAVIRDLVEKIAKIEEAARRREAEFDEHVTVLQRQIEEKQTQLEQTTAELNASLDKAEEEKREKEAKIATLDKEIANLVDEKNCLIQERDSIDQNLAKLTLEKQKLDVLLQEQFDRYKLLDENHFELKRQFEDLSADCDAKRGQLVELNQKRDEMAAKNADLMMKLDEKVVQLAEKIGELKVTKEEAAANLESALQRERIVLSEKEAISTQLNEANGRLEKEIPELTSKIGELESNLESFRQSNAILVEKCQNLTKEIEVKNEEILSDRLKFDSELVAKEIELNQIGELCYSFGVKINLLEEDAASLKENLSKVEQVLVERDLTIDGLSAEIKRYDKKVTDLAENLQQLSTTVDCKEQSIKNLKAEQQSLLAEMAAKDAELAAAVEKTAELTVEVDKLTKFADQKWQAARLDLLAKLEKAEKSVDSFVRENDALQRAIAAEAQKSDLLRSEKNEADRALRVVEKELAALKDERGVIGEKISRLEADFGEKERQLDEALQQIAKLEQEIAEKKSKKLPEKEGPQQDARRTPRKILADRHNPLITTANQSENPDILEVLTQKSPPPRVSALKGSRTPSRLAKSTPSLRFDLDDSPSEDDGGSNDETWLPTNQKRSRKSAPPVLTKPTTPKKQTVAAPPQKPVQVGPVRKLPSGAPKRIYLDPVSAPVKKAPKPVAPAVVSNKPKFDPNYDPFAFLGDI